MSKSNGAILTVSSLKEKGYNPLSFRYMCLLSHYRKQLVFTFDSLDGAENAYKKLLSKTTNLSESSNYNKDLFNSWDEKFKNCLENDLNTANAITLIYDLLKSDVDEATKYNLIKSWDNVLALDLLKKEEIDQAKIDYINEMIEKRNVAKKNKDYSLADSIRDDLLKEGIILKDTREGTIYEIK